LEYLGSRPYLSKDLQRCQLNDLEYGLAYMNAVECLRKSAYDARPGLCEVHQNAKAEGVYAYGSWDDHVERVEFYREHTLLSCGSPRFYKVVADRLLRQDDVLRRYGDCALLYYTLARVSIENDEMMQDAPERALNKVFTRVKDNRNTDRAHVELIFNLQQTVLDGLEYLEENQRELPIWGIPPFNNHQVIFHPDHAPPAHIRALIQHEMDLIDRDFDAIIHHWRSLKSKVDRHLDVLLQFRVLEQQELAISQRDLSTKQQKLAIEDAKSTRVQSRSVMIFTALTIIFLPLSFFTSYFGMNLTDLAKANYDSKFFWSVSGPISGAIIIAVFAIAKISSVGREPDEEEAVASSTDVESETSWWTRLKMRKGKVKNS
jgi:Mg2+ and Co2+ transporter CorA